MKNFLIVIFLICFTVVNVSAQVTEQKTNQYLKIKSTSYPDFPPFSYLQQEGVIEYPVSIFFVAFEDALSTNNVYTEYNFLSSYNDNVEQTRIGKTDILLGVYNETQNGFKNFDHIEYIFPAVLHNPVNLIMLNGKQTKIKNIDDLKNLRGIYVSSEYFSDYLYDRFKYLNAKPVNSALKAYEQLFLDKADYIIGSYYYHYVSALQNGLKNYLSFSKKPLWNMPMFIGISKKSKYFNRLKILLSKKVAEPSFADKIKEELKKQVHKFEQHTTGVVPPSFVSDSAPEEQTLDKDN